MADKTAIDIESLKTQSGDLTEEQRSAIQETMQEELYGEKKPDEKKEEEVVEEQEPDEKKAPEDKQETPEQKLARETEEAKKADEDLLKKPEEELSAEDKTRKADLLKVQEENAFNEDAKNLALEKTISVEDAKKELESYKKIAEKYKGNPKEMAKALLHSQREFLRLQDEHNKLKTQPQPKDLGEGESIIDGKRFTREETKKMLVETYRKEFPEVSEDMDDDKVFKLAVDRIKVKQESLHEANMKELSGQAKEKRSELINSLKDSEKEYSAEIKGLLEKTADHILMHPDWSFDDVKSWSRGRYFTPEKIEEVRKEGYKKGLEEAKILGVKGDANRGSNNGKPPVKSKGVAEQLTAEEKETALGMYKMDGIPDEKKYEMYMDFKKHQEEKKKKRGT